APPIAGLRHVGPSQHLSQIFKPNRSQGSYGYFMNKNNAFQNGVSGEYTTNGKPHGSTSLTPFFAIRNAREAVEFYRSVFGARVVDVTEMGGVVVHAELDFGDGRLQIGEPSPDFGLIPAPDGEASCYSIGYYCENVDEVV